MFDWLRRLGPEASLAVSVFGLLMLLVPLIFRWRRKRALSAFHRGARRPPRG
ncbi:MAG TPA: hypothetical protein VGG33_16625 [Polyangia bacterium]